MTKLDKLTEHVMLLDTLKHLSLRDDGDVLLNTINVLANLMWELGEARNTAATYNRTIKHGKLSVTIDYNGGQK